MRIIAMLALLTIGAAPPEDSVSFIACPIAQDQGPDLDVCFFAEYQGKRYSLTNPVDWGAPQLRHKVLVQAVVADRPAQCGGVALEGRVSVMPELSPECDMIVPPDARISSPPPNLRRAEETEAELAAIAADPSRSLRAHPLSAIVSATAEPGRTETIYYPFESDRSSGPDAARLVALAEIAREAEGARVRVRAYRGASRLDDGSTIAEHPDMAQRRADKVVAILKGLGAERASFEVSVEDGSASPSGREDWKLRRVEIRVDPA